MTLLRIRLNLEGVDARTRLATIENSWPHRSEVERARDMAVMGTDEECEAYLTQLERNINYALETWRFSQ